jgi:hypothetical protein
MVTKEDSVLLISGTFLVLAAIGLIFNMVSQANPVTGYATTANAETQAQIANYFSINSSENMSADGVVFAISSLPATSANATANYVSDASLLFLTVETDSNVNVDFCVKANASLVYGANTIELGNYTWSNSTANNVTTPDLAEASALLTTFDNSTLNVAPGSEDFYRFWLSVPSNQAPGTYRNQINFKGVQNGNECAA